MFRSAYLSSLHAEVMRIINLVDKENSMNLKLCEETARRIWNKNTPDWSLEEDSVRIGDTRIPLMPWRFDRRLMEMRGLVGKDKSVYNLCTYKSIRVDHKGTDLDSVLIKELDVCQWLTGKEIVSFYALANGEKALLALADTDSGMVCAFDIAATLSLETNPITRHEIIGVEGLITDRAINEQVPVEALYVFKDNQKNPEAFTDMDMAMLGLTPEEIQTVDYIINLLENPEQYCELQSRYNRLTELVGYIKASIESGKKVFVEDKSI